MRIGAHELNDNVQVSYEFCVRNLWTGIIFTQFETIVVPDNTRVDFMRHLFDIRSANETIGPVKDFVPTQMTGDIERST
ncbi:hypothetical protein MAR_015061 [Mya arenaria]|uniref:Uncharacterized protein n=1 Tax=Mya arenaria TaxID=6604 RepID=A0ABY7FJ81_MYAAR|nr:hypothetical protein MAR_015061 [Mya arenaria]